MNKRCENKRRYRQELDAKMALERIRSKGQKNHTEQRYYLCPFCCNYHLTSQEKRSK